MTPPHQRPLVADEGTPGLLANRRRAVSWIREQACAYKEHKPGTRVRASLMANHNYTEAQLRERARSCEKQNRDPVSYQARRWA